MASRQPPHQKAYLDLGKRAQAFAKMVADFHGMGSGEFRKLYPDYNYDGTDYICRRAEALAEEMNAYAATNLSRGEREARAKQAA